MAPIFFLFKRTSGGDVKVAFVFLFILIFTLATSVFATPRLHELFDVTTAYVYFFRVHSHHLDDIQINCISDIMSTK